MTAPPRFAPLALAALLAACASPGAIAPAATPRPATEVGLQDTADHAALVTPTWWTAFGDPQLDALVGRALADNPGLKAVDARARKAAAAVAGARAEEAPRVDGSLDATRQRYTENGLYPPPIAGSVQTSANLQATLHWDLDFFGRNRAALAAAIGAERAAAAETAAARLQLTGNVARGYVGLARLLEQRRIAERSLAQRDEVLSLVRQRVGAGLDTNVELRQAEGALPEVRAQIEALDEQIALARHALAALSAQPPAALDALAPELRAVHAVDVPAALPVDLLGQRADVSAARWRVEAATQDVAQARTLFYPNVDLMAFVGLNSFGLDRLLRAGSENFGVGPALRLPLFDAGRLRANLRGRTADLDAAVESYNAAVLDAVRDAADQIASLQSVGRQQGEQAAAQGAAESAYDLALQRYRAGLGTYLVVLTAETNVLAQRRAAAELKARALDAQVALARALGGGYRDAPTLAARTEQQ
ncbi:MAG TPA: efflux transporter outer membrane subunit [Ideonella sp.]|nr:efflux transporter outer membrane subunit [Ideonella sp.]